MNFEGYDIGNFYDEMFASRGTPRGGTRLLAQKIASLPEGELERRQKAAEKAFSTWGSPSMSTETRRARKKSGRST